MEKTLLNYLVVALTVLFSINLGAQCPQEEIEITNVQTVACSGSFDVFGILCPLDNYTINLEQDIELPPNSFITWYQDTDNNVDLISNNIIGTSNINTNPTTVAPCMPCPELLGIMVDACSDGIYGVEPQNEFVVIGSGGGFNTGDLSLDYASSNNFANNPMAMLLNSDITPGGNCQVTEPSPTVINNLLLSANCTQVFPAGNNTDIPSGAVYIIFTSCDAGTFYNFDALCANGAPLYVSQSTCCRERGAFSNGTSNGLRTTSITIDCPECVNAIAPNITSTITHDTDNPILETIPSGSGGGIVYRDINGNLVYAATNCEAPPVNLIPLPPLTSTLDPFSNFIDYADCGNTFYIQGLLTPTFDGCNPTLTEVFTYEVVCEEPMLQSVEVCLGQIVDLTEIADPNFPSGGWVGNDIENNSTFEPDQLGSYTLEFYPLDCCTDSASINIVVTEGASVMVMPDTLVCPGQAEINLDDLILEINIPDGSWNGVGVNGSVFDPNGFEDEIVIVTFDPEECGPESNVNIFISQSPVQMFTETICRTDSVVINGEVYNFDRATDTQFLQAATGCDTAFSILLDFYDQPESMYFDSICTGKDIMIGDSTFNESKLSGTVIFSGFSADGCDSLVNVEIIVKQEPPINNFTEAICPGDSIEIGGEFFHQDMLTGSVMVPSFNGCDSTININLQLIADAVNNVSFSLCASQDTMINSVIYTESNPTGRDTIENAAINGCDSILIVNIDFLSPSMSTPIENVICEGDGFELNIGDQTFNESNPTGFGRLVASNGCDSIVPVELTVLENQAGPEFTQSLCAGSNFSVTFGDDTFDASNTSGTARIPANNGCDSLFSVNLIFSGDIDGEDFETTECTGSNFEITFGSQTFNEANPNGMATVQTAEGCDSTFNVTINYAPSITGDDFFRTSCVGSGLEVTFGSDTFNESNPSGIATLQTTEGCDSTFQVNLVFSAGVTGPDYTDADCTGSGLEVTFGTQTFNESNPTGMATINSAAGCDSTFNVVLTFQDEVMGPDYTDADCTGSGLEVTFGTQTFNEVNPTGMATINSTAGCDSTFNVILTFQDEVMGPDYTDADCTGSGLEVTFGTQTFNEANPTGIAIINSAAGCDSTFNVILIFQDEVMGPDYTDSDCVGSGLEVTFGTQTFNEANPNGIAIITSANGCDSTFNVILTFQDEVMGPDYTDADCTGSGLEVTFGTQTFNETNPSGIATINSAAGCDSTFNVILTFQDEVMGPDYTDSDCVGSGLEVTFGTQTFNEANPNGIAIITSAAGCDSTFNVILIFQDEVMGPDYTDSDCVGSGLEVTFGTQTFNEANPNGIAIITSANGCDSTFNVILTFQDEVMGPDYTDADCTGSGLEVTFGTQTFNEANPIGIATILSAAGCDSTFNVILNFQDEVMGPDYTDADCTGSGLEVTFGTQTFNEANPTGMATINSEAECDSTFNVILTFQDEVMGPDYTDSDCVGSGLEVTFGTQTFNEVNPNGIAIITSANGCDSTFNVILTFQDEVMGPDYTDADCTGSGLEVTFGTQTFNEANPTGMATINSAAGCDSTFNVILTFQDEVMGPDYTDSDCVGSGLGVTFGTQTFNEVNPNGIAIITSAAGCDSTFNVILTFEGVNLTLAGGEAICTGDMSTLILVTNSTDNFDVVIGNSQNEEESFTNIQSGFEFIVSPTSTTSYFIQSANGSDCEFLFGNQIEVQVSEIEVEIIPGNNGGTIDCEEEGNGVLETEVTGAIGQVEYEWNQGGNTSVIDNLSSGAYSVIVTDEIGCTDSDNFELINQSEIEIDFTLERTGCDGSIGILTILNIQGGSGDLYSIFLDDLTSPLTQPEFPITFSLGPGAHMINVIDEFGCSRMEEFEVTPTDPEDVFLTVSEDQVIEQGASIVLSVDGNFSLDSIIWSPEISLSCTNCTNPIAQPVQTTIYNVTAFDNSGCSATAQILVQVDRQTNIYIPNVFSPNEDGFNDVFYIFGGLDVAMVTSFSIFDRWGNQVFFAENIPHSNPQFGWDGKYRGKKKQPDVFVYYGVIELIDGTFVEVEGNVTLIK